MTRLALEDVVQFVDAGRHAEVNAFVAKVHYDPTHERGVNLDDDEERRSWAMLKRKPC